MTNKILINFLLLVIASVASADTSKTTLSVGLSYEYTDNVFLSPYLIMPDSIYHALLDLSYNKKTAILDLDFKLSLDRQEYQKNSYLNTTVGSSRLALAGMLSKNRLYWDMYDRFDNVPNTVLSPNIPYNNQNVNYFLTGPRFLLISDPRNSLTTTAKYQNFYTETSLTDYAGYIYNLNYTRKVTRTLSVGLATNYNEVNYDNQALNTDYARTDITVNLDKLFKHSEFNFEVGKTKYKLTGANRDGDIFRAKYNLSLSERTRLDIQYQRELSDFSNVFSNTSSLNNNLPDIGSSFFVLEAGDISLLRRFGYSDITFNYSYFKNDYINDIQDIISNGTSLVFNHKLSPATGLNMKASYHHINYPSTDVVVKEKVFSVGLTRQIANRYSLELKLQYSNRVSSDIFFVNGFTERRANIIGHYYIR